MHDALEKARAMLENVTPLKTDCGKVCSGRCCRPLEAEETGMLLTIGDMYEDKVERHLSFDENAIPLHLS